MSPLARLLLGVLVFIGAVILLERRNQCRRVESNGHDPIEQNLNHAALASAGKKKKHPTEEEHRSAEQEHWWRQNIIGLAALALSTAAGIAGFSGLFQAIRAANEAHNQAVAAQGQLDTMQDAQRPWIDNTTAYPIAPFVIGPDGAARMNVQFMLRNTGHYPAFHVLIVTEMFTRSFDAHEMSAIRLKCAKTRYRPTDRPPTGITIFPDQQQIPMIVNFVASPPELEKLKTIQYAVMMIAGCIDYVYPFSIIHHQTQFVYEVDRAGPNNSLLVINPIGTTDQTDVRLLLNPRLTGEAD